VTGVGSLLTVLFTDRQIVNYRDTATADRDLIEAFHLAWLNRGLFSATRGMMALSLAMGPKEVSEALDTTKSVLEALTATM
jgi:glutamate-1-semialdehyde aminotransferase